MGAPVDDDAGFAALRSWVTSQGGEVGPITLRATTGGRGMVSRCALDAGAVLLRVPPHAWWTAPPAPGWTGDAAGTVALSWALCRAAAGGEWAAYRASLPTAVPDHPLSFDAALRAALRGSTFGLLSAELARQVADEAMWAATHGVDAAMWTWARTVVTSRRFARGADAALVPIADLFDHALDPEVDWDWAPDGAFVMRLVRPVPAGAPLHDGYGRKSNLRLLLHYGFTLPGNPEAEALITLPAGRTVRLARSATLPPALVADLELDHERTPRRRRGWRRFADLLRGQLAGVPSSSSPALQAALGRTEASVHVRRVLDEERAVLAHWQAAATQAAEAEAKT